MHAMKKETEADSVVSQAIRVRRIKMSTKIEYKVRENIPRIKTPNFEAKLMELWNCQQFVLILQFFQVPETSARPPRL